MSWKTALPYVVGQWVRGDRFYGREALLAEILDGGRDSLWVVGSRRIGKTSLLKQLELLTAAGRRGFFPLYWDLQGTDNPAELDLTFADALLDAGERLAELGIDAEASGEGGLFASLNAIRDRLRSREQTLLLLCDETEELITLQDHHPASLDTLRAYLQPGAGVRTVLASSVRLSVLVEPRPDTSPFLDGFTPPLYIAGLTNEEAHALIRQDHLPEGDRPAFDAPTASAIGERCGNHPYLLQLLTKRCLELGDLEAACARVGSDRMIDYLFSVDLDLLSVKEQHLLPTIARLAPASLAMLGQRLGCS